jgi:hypothetical protein
MAAPAHVFSLFPTPSAAFGQSGCSGSNMRHFASLMIFTPQLRIGISHPLIAIDVPAGDSIAGKPREAPLSLTFREKTGKERRGAWGLDTQKCRAQPFISSLPATPSIENPLPKEVVLNETVLNDQERSG